MKSPAFLQQKDPMIIFKQWLLEAQSIGLKQPGAFTLVSASASGQPSARVLLLKGLEQESLIFYTNYSSRKGEELGENPQAGAHFYWDSLGRQIKICGTVKKLSAEKNQKYWSTRPRESQIAQLISDQSKPAPDRTVLEEAYEKATQEMTGLEIPCPANWGGYELQINEIEFWLADKRRFHDRYHYMKVEDCWQNRRLFP